MPDFPSTISSKLPHAGTTIFSVMSKLAQEHHAVNLSQGFPDFDCDPELIRLVNEYMKKGMNQYCPMPGVIRLREVLSEKTEKSYGSKYHPETEITITAGATQAIYTAIAAVVREDDEVIVFTPAYDCYVPAIELNGGKPVFVRMNFPDYSIDWEAVQKLINHRTRLIILNTPHNPSGTVLRAGDMEKLARLTRDSDIMILSDEVYEHVVFDEEGHQSVRRFPGLAERSFVVGSFGKSYHTTGWKTGYCMAPAAMMAEFRKVHQYIVFTANTPLQYAFADYLQQDREEEVRSFYQDKRDFFQATLKGSGLELFPCTGTYFQLAGYGGISDEKDTEFARLLTTRFGVASIPVSVFYSVPHDNHVLRLCFAKREETLAKAGELLTKAVKSFKGG